MIFVLFLLFLYWLSGIPRRHRTAQAAKLQAKLAATQLEWYRRQMPDLEAAEERDLDRRQNIMVGAILGALLLVSLIGWLLR